MMAGVIMAFFDASPKWYRCLLNNLLFPLFLIIVLLLWVIAAGMAMGAVANGDFCLPSGRVQGPDGSSLRGNYEPPDESVLDILVLAGIENVNPMALDIAKYFIQQCSTGSTLR